jgi:hypothetical protein
MNGKVWGNGYDIGLAAVGGCMATGIELVATRMLSPFYGSGLTVWAAVLAAVLTGFAGGYFAGGQWFGRGRPRSDVGGLYLLCAGYLLLAGWLCAPLMAWSYALCGHNGVIPMGVVLATPPIALLAAATPGLLSGPAAGEPVAGKATGRLYGASTIGGMIGIFGYGFWLMPLLGVFLAWLTLIGGTCLLGLAATLLLRTGARWRLVAGLAIVCGGIAWVMVRPHVLPDHIRLKSVDMMGELIVTDLPLEPEYGGGPRRMILNNRIAQTAVDPTTGVSLWDYTHYLSSIAGLQPVDSRVLLLGLAGGSVADELASQGLQVDAVDIDPRLPVIARTHFHLDPAVKVIVDDARHYLNTCTKTYDLIVYDLFAGEGQPSHVFSQEAFARAQGLLSPSGMLLINGHGFWDGAEGLGTRSRVQPLQHTDSRCADRPQHAPLGDTRATVPAATAPAPKCLLPCPCSRHQICDPAAHGRRLCRRPAPDRRPPRARPLESPGLPSLARLCHRALPHSPARPWTPLLLIAPQPT